MEEELDISETNLAYLGSDVEIGFRKTRAELEASWQGIGQQVGRWIWRIEKFEVKPWPTERHGTFYQGDSFIVLNTFKKPEDDKLWHDIHFWIGKDSTQDEYGTAAYKTVELDDYLDGVANQHREVQGFESHLFISYFHEIKILLGGVDTGFRRVSAETHTTRLFEITLTNNQTACCREVPVSSNSLKTNALFALDGQKAIYQWRGKKAPFAALPKAQEISRWLESDRNGKVKVIECEEDTAPLDFWKEMGSQEAQVLKVQVAKAAAPVKAFIKKLYRLSDSTGSLKLTLEKEADKIDRTLLKSQDVFILDDGKSVWVWVGQKSSETEKRSSILTAEKYLAHYKRPAYTQITRIVEGRESLPFTRALSVAA